MRTYVFFFIAVLLWVCAAYRLSAQVLFSEDFQGGAMPSGFTLVDNDGNTPASPVSFINDAWVVIRDDQDTGNYLAVSTSWYDTPAQADDWMITPLIQLDSFSLLQWRARAYDESFPDGYEVRLSITDTALTSFTTVLFSTSAENTSWTSRSVYLPDLGLINQSVYLAFRNNSFDQNQLYVDDIVVRKLPPVDVALAGIEVPRSSCQLSSNEDVTAIIINFGRDTLTAFDISYVVYDGATYDTVTENVTVSLPPNGTFHYTFNTGADLSATGTSFSIFAFVTASNDADMSNNTSDAVTIVHINPHDPSVPYFTSFETSLEMLGWSYEDVNQDNFTWYPAIGGAHSGDVFFIYEYNYDAITPADDWLFSTCMDLTAGKVYELSFYYSVGNFQGTVYPEKLEIGLGTAPSSSAMTVVEDLGSINNDFYQNHTTRFSVITSGVYYVGFHAYSDPDQFYLALDDAQIRELPLPVAGMDTSINGLAVQFTNQSTDADSVYWIFGDGNTSLEDNPLHIYSAPGNYTVCLIAINPVGTDTTCITIAVDTLVNGMHSDLNLFIHISPNPSAGMLQVYWLKNNTPAFYRVFDSYGRLILSKRNDGHLTVLDLSALSAGIYWLTISAEGQIYRVPVVLTR
ncbi:MAG: hypothetical protein KatS3mg031_0886 [Chitinophagales bacterium]|nr:MAG: hypothetical protein KatS3mg031_0886 [Chitinophagales bacterium]